MAETARKKMGYNSLKEADKKSALLVGNCSAPGVGTAGPTQDLLALLIAEGWSIRACSHKRRRVAKLIDMLGTTYRYRHDYGVAVVETYSGRAFIWAELVCLLLHLLGKPYVLVLCGGNLPMFAQKWSGRVRRLFRNADAIISPSPYWIEQMRELSEGMTLLSYGFDLGALEFRPRCNLSPTLVWLRAFHAIYNPPLAAKVVAILAQKFPDVRLTMVGPDKGDGSLQGTRRAALEWGVLDRISFPGGIRKSEVPGALNQGDIFLNTTNFDGAPRCIIEAMACGLCVVTTNVGGIPYWLEDEHDALLVPPDDAEAMARAVERILTNPDLARRLSTNARRKAEQLDWSIVLRQWEDLLLSVEHRYAS